MPTPQRLPSVGHLLDLVDDDGHPVQVVRRKDGTLEVHVDGRTTILDPVQAQALGLLASGHILVRPELVARTSAVLGGLEFDWVTVPPGAAAAIGKSIEELAVRRKTGTTIVAIFRGSLPVVDPDPNQRIEAGDDLVVACQPEQRDALERFLVDGA